MKRNSGLGVLIFAVSMAIVSGIAVSGLLTTQRVLSSSGSVKAINVEVYWDALCTQVVDSVDWGTPGPGDSVSKTVYVKNIGNAPLTLSMSCSGWNPSEAQTYLTLSWDAEGAQVNADEVVTAVLTLSVSESVTGITDFSFNIVIEGSG